MPDMNVTEIDEDAVLKEVWNVADVESKTELNSDQIMKVNKLQTLATIFDNNLLNLHLNEFMVLQKSKDRKSMDEFVSVVRAKKEDRLSKGSGFFNSMLG